MYLVNPHVGHLGIFVSAKVARLQHRAMLEHMTDIRALEPGLYQMRIDNPTSSDDARKPEYAVRFAERDVGDLEFPYPRGAFERARQVSALNEACYRLLASPWVKLAATPWSAAWTKRLHPMRLKSALASERVNPMMHGVRALARRVENNRHPVASNNPWKRQEAQTVDAVADAIEKTRKQRDRSLEQLFRQFYGENAGFAVNVLQLPASVRYCWNT